MMKTVMRDIGLPHTVNGIAMKIIVDEIPNAQLLIIGEGKTEDALKKLSVDLGVEKNVVFYPIVNKTSKMLNMLDVFIMPSRMEGLGLSVLEAQAAGLPVVASNVGGIPTLIKDGKTGYLVEPENVDALAKAIVKVLQNMEGARAVGLNGRRFVEENFSSDKMVSKTIELYNAILESK